MGWPYTRSYLVLVTIATALTTATFIATAAASTAAASLTTYARV